MFDLARRAWHLSLSLAPLIALALALVAGRRWA
jgi:hypothetical protein